MKCRCGSEMEFVLEVRYIDGSCMGDSWWCPECGNLCVRRTTNEEGECDEQWKTPTGLTEHSASSVLPGAASGKWAEVTVGPMGTGFRLERRDMSTVFHVRPTEAYNGWFLDEFHGAEDRSGSDYYGATLYETAQQAMTEAFRRFDELVRNRAGVA